MSCFSFPASRLPGKGFLELNAMNYQLRAMSCISFPASEDFEPSAFSLNICVNLRNLWIIIWGSNLRKSALRAVGFYPPACKPYGLEAEPEA